MPDVTVSDHRFHLTGRIIIGGVIAILALVLLLQNTADVQVHVLFWHSDHPLWLWFLVLFAGGFVVGSLFPWTWMQNRRHHKESAPAEPSSV
jgi:uncharacterized integral membrane protein